MNKSTFVICCVAAINAALLALALFLSSRTGIDPSSFYGDPNAVARQSFAMGFLSNTGAIAWISAASISLFSWWLRRSFAADDRDSWSLLLFGLLTAWLGLDDLLMFHDGLADHLGISQLAFVSVDAVMAMAWVATALLSPSRFGSNSLLLILAVAGLGGSLVIDQSIDAELLYFPGASLIEDVVKLTGIMFWAAYALNLSHGHVAALLRREAQVAPGPAQAATPEIVGVRSADALR
ncbi:hypothetical protein [Microvirga subterranea]|uniref:Oxidase n=1 Tax=Microvirga subterranea TaxID=186651 RepID=A0A370HMV3_9HYPH|nr:hypothetical protein [Microvirga subterranea]RDI59906.1 hypothetical protein DES45_103162 [Microvirga subterranea]